MSQSCATHAAADLHVDGGGRLHTAFTDTALSLTATGDDGFAADVPTLAVTAARSVWAPPNPGPPQGSAGIHAATGR